ncbi:iron ABC transporter ATP-binding protein [Paracidovorax avenae]|uniref:ABC transporter ATP-binding protein n=1 Tax=Paracidovorax avenae TaxID=80867 RepID=UPI000D20C239|nr:ABC transporter ATP-binding protein [Paracidovorax avenae]AVS79319.1 iron ABC transporter ATP-binding protein [Paracidovorax avenae]
MSAGLHIAHLGVAYGRRRVIDGLTAPALQPGTVTAVLGPNGSGKSTLLRALAGLVRADGSVALDGEALERASLAERARRIVYLPQALPAAVHLRVIESLLAARNASPHDTRAGDGLRAESAVEESAELLQRLGIGHLAMRHLDELSGGQAQLAGLAQALIRQPRVLLLDEPLSALDLNHQFHVMSLVREEAVRHGMVTLVVLHDLGIALRHADRVLVLRDGQLMADGPPAEAIDPALLARVYGVQARVEPCSRGLPQVIVDGLTAA